jgi:hypothetical protein
MSEGSFSLKMCVNQETREVCLQSEMLAELHTKKCKCFGF